MAGAGKQDRVVVRYVEDLETIAPEAFDQPAASNRKP